MPKTWANLVDKHQVDKFCDMQNIDMVKTGTYVALMSEDDITLDGDDRQQTVQDIFAALDDLKIPVAGPYPQAMLKGTGVSHAHIPTRLTVKGASSRKSPNSRPHVSSSSQGRPQAPMQRGGTQRHLSIRVQRRDSLPPRRCSTLCPLQRGPRPSRSQP